MLGCWVGELQVKSGVAERTPRMVSPLRDLFGVRKTPPIWQLF